MRAQNPRRADVNTCNIVGAGGWDTDAICGDCGIAEIVGEITGSGGPKLADASTEGDIACPKTWSLQANGRTVVRNTIARRAQLLRCSRMMTVIFMR